MRKMLFTKNIATFNTVQADLGKSAARPVEIGNRGGIKDEQVNYFTSDAILPRSNKFLLTEKKNQ